MPPYIDPAKRKPLELGNITDGGTLCYTFSLLCKAYLKYHGESYATYGEIRHALATTWDEFVQPQMRDYETAKKAANGAV